jgi:hypothetical protein
MKHFIETNPNKHSKHVLVNEWPINEAVSAKIQQHPEYKSITSGAGQSSIAEILSIARRLFSDTELDPHLRQEHARDKLSSTKMENAYAYHRYLQRFNEARRVVIQEGGRIENAVLIQYFREGLHDLPFAEQKRNHRDRVLRKQFSNTIEGFIAEMTNAYQDWEKLKMPIEKDAAIVLNVTGAKDEGDDSDEEIESESLVKAQPKKHQHMKCEICGVRHRGQCTNAEAWKRYYQEKRERDESELAKKLEKLASIGKKQAKGARRVGTLRVRVGGTDSDED